LDSFRPLLEVTKREDMLDFRMLLLRLASGFAIYYGVTEFMREPQNLDSLLNGGGELINEMFEWGQNKFLGVADNSTMIQTKKSARQIYAEAFMEDETNGMFGMGSQRRFYDEDHPQKPSSESGSLENGDEQEEDGIKQESET
jgi:hypothetical protein